MVIVTKYDIGDIVSISSIHDARIMGIKFYSGITYDIQYFNDNISVTYSAYEWELKLVEKFNKE
jgi:hypothetical protein